MTESQFTQRLLRELRRRMPDAVIFKHNDRTTGGIPDFSITVGGKTTWWEVKVYPNKLSTLQMETLRRLGSACAYLVISRGEAFSRIIANSERQWNFHDFKSLEIAICMLASPHS